MTTTETPLIVAEKRALEEELHALKMSFYDRREADAEIESFKQTIKQLEEKLEQLRNECQELYKQKHEYAEEQISRMFYHCESNSIDEIDFQETMLDD
jgi:chromosome segregation ATPase